MSREKADGHSSTIEIGKKAMKKEWEVEPFPDFPAKFRRKKDEAE